ncbi:MAG: hypothetical protein OXC95_17030, partial [Dehalococcoidia bacterium]|nr:hypothetical protein [Dehalococcoidia bacterium]
TDHSLWVDPPFYDVPKFMVVEGGYQDAEQLSSTLKDMGYHTSAHNGVTYYRWLLGDVMNLRRIQELRTNASLNFGLNTIAPIGEKLILSQREEWTKNLIEVHQGSRLSLYDLKHYRELAQAVGDEALAGAFVAPEFVEWTWTDMGVKPIEHLERYTSGPDAWSDLEPYTVAIVGNGVRNGVVNTIVALHYSDPSGAERNAQELKRRWDSAKFQAEEVRVFPPPVKDPFAGICTPLETRTTAVGQSSILIGTCGTSEHRVVGGPMLDGLHSWYALMEYKELHFLIPNLEEVIHAAAK